VGWFAALSAGRKAGVVIGSIVVLLLAITGVILAIGAREKAAKQAGRDEVQAQWNSEKAGRAQAAAQFQGAITASLQPQFDLLSSSLRRIDTEGAKIDIALPAAVAAEPRYRDPTCALTAPVLEQVNAARALAAAPIAEQAP